MSGTVTLVVEQLRRPVTGGIGTYTRGLIGGLAALGDDAPPVVLRASRSPVHPDPLADFGLPLDVSRLPGRALVAAWQAGCFPVRRGALTHAVSLAAPPSRPPLVVTVHDLAFRALPATFPARGRRWHEAALARALRHAAAFVVPADPVADALVEAGAPRSVVRVIPEGADHLPAPDLASADALLAQIAVTGPFLLAVGTLEPRKNLARLVRAYARARPALEEPWPLVVAGPTGWGPSSAGLAGATGVVLAGQVDDRVLAGLYARARVLCYVPLLEGFGLPVAEAMHAGLPVVASAVPSAGDAALVVDPADEESIAQGLVRAAQDETVRARLVAAGRARAAAHTWRACAAAHVALWAEVA